MSDILSQDEVDALLKALEDMPEVQKAIDESTSRNLAELGYAVEAAKKPAKEETLQDWLDVLL